MTQTGLTPGMYRNLPFPDYLALDGVSHSHLLALARSPAHLRWMLDHPEDGEDTSAMRIGSAVHCALLQPHIYSTAYAVAPKVDRRTKEGKATYEVFVREHPGACILSHDEGSIVDGIRGALAFRPALQAILSGPGEHELTIVWEDPMTGLLCKGRLDRYYVDKRGLPVILDLKTTLDASPRAVVHDIAFRRYHLQGTYYALGMAALRGGLVHDQVRILAVEKAPPYGVSVTELGLDAIETGRREISALLHAYKLCVERNLWPDYGLALHRASLPAWYQPAHEETGLMEWIRS